MNSSDQNRQFMSMKTAELLNLSIVTEGVERIEKIRTFSRLRINLFLRYYFTRMAIGVLSRDQDIPWSAVG